MESRRRGELTWGLVGAWIGTLLVATIAAGAGVACLAVWRSGGEFDWSLAAVAATAFGTTALAGFTGALAWTTSGDVSATWEIANLTRQEQELRERPQVVVVELEVGDLVHGWTETGEGKRPFGSGTVTYEIMNLGQAAALDVSVQLRYEDEAGHVGFNPPIETVRVLRPGQAEKRTVKMSWGAVDPMGIFMSTGLVAFGRYTDAGRVEPREIKPYGIRRAAVDQILHARQGDSA